MWRLATTLDNADLYHLKSSREGQRLVHGPKMARQLNVAYFHFRTFLKCSFIEYSQNGVFRAGEIIERFLFKFIKAINFSMIEFKKHANSIFKFLKILQIFKK